MSTRIPSKARAMLGLPPSASRPPLPAVWTRPTRGWGERVRELEARLEGEVGRLVECCLGVDYEEWRGVKALGTALGEVLKASRD